MTSVPGVVGSFLAGLLSFLSPCVLPLIPAYVSFISGESLGSIRAGAARLQVFLSSVFFVLGLTTVFVLFSIVFSGGVQLAGAGVLTVLTRVAGVGVILLCLNTIFDVVPFLRVERRMHTTVRRVGVFRAYLFGLLFATGWTPCVGPILSSLLFYAASSGQLLHAAGLLTVYALGLGLPFVFAGIFFGRAERVFAWVKSHMHAVKLASGMLIVFFGLLMLTSGLQALSRLFLRAGFALEEYSTRGITPLRQIAALLAQWFLYQGV